MLISFRNIQRHSPNTTLSNIEHSMAQSRWHKMKQHRTYSLKQSTLLWWQQTYYLLYFKDYISTNTTYGEGNGNPLQCSCLENPRDGGAWWAAICGVAQSQYDWSDLAVAVAIQPKSNLYFLEPAVQLHYAFSGPHISDSWSANHFIHNLILIALKVKSLSHVRLFATPWTSLSGFSVHGIFQARVLEWVAISFSMGSSRSRNQTQVSLIAGRHFTVWA